MKNVFVTGLFPGQHETFIKGLGEHFQLWTTQRHDPWIRDIVSNANFIEEATKAPLSSSQTLDELFQLAIRHAQEITQKKISIDPEQTFVAEFRKRAETAHQDSLLLIEFCKSHSLSMVIVGSDMSGSRRPFTLVAKRNGIPTLDVEHGYWSISPEPQAMLSNSRPLVCMLSDYVIVDNIIEKDIAELYHKQYATSLPTFLPFGTPLDHSVLPNTNRNDSAKALGIDPAKFTITILGTWTYGTFPSGILKQQIELADHYRSVFSALQRIRFPYQLVIKLHPSHLHKATLKNTQGYLEVLAHEIGISIDRITVSDLHHVIACSNVVLCAADSSALYEAFLGRVPGIIFPVPYHQTYRYHTHLLNQSSVFTRAGLLRWVFSQDELIHEIEEFSKPDVMNQYMDENNALRSQYQLQEESAQVKTSRILQWMESLFQQS